MTALNKQALRYGDNVLWFLNELAAYDASDIDGGEFDVYGEDRNGLEGCSTIDVTELAADAAKLIEAAEKRIAELEARKFKVEMPEPFYPDGDIDAPLAVDELEVIAAIVEAGGKPVAFCKRCDREIDLTHRPDGSHYCHAPAAGIGVKGE